MQHIDDQCDHFDWIDTCFWCMPSIHPLSPCIPPVFFSWPGFSFQTRWQIDIKYNVCSLEEFAYIVGRTSNIVYSRKLFARLCQHCTINTDCLSACLYPRTCDVDVWSLLPPLLWRKNSFKTPSLLRLMYDMNNLEKNWQSYFITICFEESTEADTYLSFSS